MISSEADVVIVRRRPAGVAAARRLASGGYSVLMVEALDRIRRAGVDARISAGWRLISGAAGSTRPSAIRGWRLQRLSAPDRSNAAGVGRAVSRPGIPRSGSSMRPERHSLSGVRAFVARARVTGRPMRWNRGCGWNGFIEALSGYINGAQLHELSIADYLAYDDAASETNWRLPRGYGALVEAEGGGTTACVADEGIRDRSCTRRGADRDIAWHDPRRSRDRHRVQQRARHGRYPPPTFVAPAIEAAAQLPLGVADKLFLSVEDFPRPCQRTGIFSAIRIRPAPAAIICARSAGR